MQARPNNRIILAGIGWIVKVFLTDPSRPIGLPSLGRADDVRGVALLL